MKNYLERYGRSLRVSFDPVTKTFIEIPVNSLRFLPVKFVVPTKEEQLLQEKQTLRFAAE